MGYHGYGLPVGELISEGNIGMMQARVTMLEDLAGQYGYFARARAADRSARP